MSRLARGSSSPWSNSLTELPPSAACISSSLSPGEEENCLIQSSRELHARAALSSHARQVPRGMENSNCSTFDPALLPGD